MAIVLIASEDTDRVSVLVGTIASLGHTPLPLVTTENVVEDVTLNEVDLVILSEHLRPYSGWETCEMLRNDPTIPRDLPILLLCHGKGNVRRIESSGFTGTMDERASSGELAEEVVGYLGDSAGPGDLDAIADLRLER